MQLFKFAFQTGVLLKGMESVPLHQFLHINHVSLVLALLSNKNYRVWFEVPYIFKGVLKDVMLPITLLPCPSMVTDHNAASCREVPSCGYTYDFDRCCLQRPLSKQEMLFAYKISSGSFHEPIIFSKNATIFSHIHLTSTSSTLVWPPSELVSGRVTLRVE